jgi:hypothetical protein
MQMFGYEWVDVDHQHSRFIHEMARFHQTWNVQGEVSAAALSGDGLVANWTVATRAPNWDVATDYHYLRWDDIVTADRSVSDWRRFPAGIAALLDFAITGTGFKYFVFAWRYGCFFLYPLVAIGVMGALSIWLASSALSVAGLPRTWLWLAVATAAAFIALWWLLRTRIFIRYALDDWCFARDFVRGRRPEVDRRLDRFAHELVRLARESDADEIVVDGTSLGAPLTLLIVDRALALDPELGRRGKPIHLVSSGSSLLKLALHPAATGLRQAVGRVASEPAVYWVEFQAEEDFLNVYNVDPVVALGMPATGKPIVKLMSVRQMVDEATFRRLQINFFRMHRQGRSGNERRYYYDYYMLCCGPIALADRVENPDQAVAAFAADGSLAGRASAEDVPARGLSVTTEPSR